ncbi:DUF533 domain-containing protein [Candidatus Accumulibacter sp. ACC003]|uniref:YcjF family protein n=1 Tax=Candidatus Accumulibacter sp. ACC003 TaxID=2823334 RepID=UPI0025C61250|nr:DUF533 domain-containing protein [Candidatus Accumulibacter sp. ACC003]
MNHDEQKAVLAIALYAAFADGVKNDHERQEVRRIADALAEQSGAPDLARLYQDVLLKRLPLASAAAALTDPGQRQLAYEMAVCVCEADGRLADAERRFLATLQPLLGLDSAQAALIEGEVDDIVDQSEAGAPVNSGIAVANTPPSTLAAQPKVAEAELDQSILKHALLNGALELLPQSWASMAIIPLQIRMVYGIGRAHGVELDQGHIKEFIAAAGVGLTSQYLEQFGRKLLGGLLGKAAGKTFGKTAGKTSGKVGGAAVGMAFSFATTYALGMVAKRYYAGGRTMHTAMLRDAFQNLLGPAKQLQAQYLPQIQQQASTLDAGQIMALLRASTEHPA